MDSFWRSLLPIRTSTSFGTVSDSNVISLPGLEPGIPNRHISHHASCHLQPYSLRFLQTLDTINFPANSQSVKVIRNQQPNSRNCLFCTGNVLGEPVQVVAVRTKVR